MATLVSTSNNRRMIMTSAAILAVGVGAYGLGRVYPPLGPSAGTVVPADRYVSSQISEADVTLGDTAVPQLMQTDAFELFVHDPQFRALVGSPGFRALAGNPQVMSALLSNPRSFADLAGHPQAFSAFLEAAKNAGSLGHQSHQASADLMGLVAGHPGAMEGLASHPEALAAIMSDASSFGRFANNAKAFNDTAASGSAALKQLAGDKSAMSAILADPQVFAALSANAGSWKGLTGHPEALAAAVDSAASAAHQLEAEGVSNGGLQVLASNGAAFETLAGQPKALTAISSHWQAFAGLAGHPEALQAIMSEGSAFGKYSSTRRRARREARCRITRMPSRSLPPTMWR
jgi:hypothetical protein